MRYCEAKSQCIIYETLLHKNLGVIVEEKVELGELGKTKKLQPYTKNHGQRRNTEREKWQQVSVAVSEKVVDLSSKKELHGLWSWKDIINSSLKFWSLLLVAHFKTVILKKKFSLCVISV